MPAIPFLSPEADISIPAPFPADRSWHTPSISKAPSNRSQEIDRQFPKPDVTCGDSLVTGRDQEGGADVAIDLVEQVHHLIGGFTRTFAAKARWRANPVARFLRIALRKRRIALDHSIVWITGAGKGIGRALALELAASGHVVAASARTEADLKSLIEEASAKGGEVHTYRLDITDQEDARAVVRSIEEDLGPIGLAVLNAGTHAEISGASFDLETFRHVVDTNLSGTANCLAAILPPLVERRHGHVAVVASVAGYRGLPTAGAYAASKAGLIALSEAMKPELEAVGVQLQLINPGFVETPLTRQNTFAMPFLMPPEQAARAIVRGLGSKRFEIVFPWQMALAMRFLRLLPYPLLFGLTQRMVRPPRA